MGQKPLSKTEEHLRIENEELRTRLAESEEALNAIRNGKVDAIVVSGADGEKIFSLASSETPYRIIVEEMNEGTAIVSADGIILYCNRRFAELVSTPLEKITGSNFIQSIAENDKSKYDDLLHTGLKERCSGEITRLIHDSNPVHFYLSFSPLPPDMLGDVCIIAMDITELKRKEEELRRSHDTLEQRIIERTATIFKTLEELETSRIAALKMVEDAVEAKKILETANENLIKEITKRKLAEEELEKHREHLEEIVKERTNELSRSRNTLHTLIDSLPDEIYAKDSESRFIMANFRVLNTFGLSDFRNILGKTDFDLLPGEEAMKAYAKEYAVLQHDGQMINYEENIMDTDGKIRWLSVIKVPIRDREGSITGLVGINRDITYIKESEETLKEAKEAAEAANIAKSTFLSNMSHEIRTPLNAILGFSQLMQCDDKLSKEHIEWLRTINRSGEHLLALINDILEVSRIEAGRIIFNPSNFDLHALLHDIEAMFRIKTDAKNLTLLSEYFDELPRYVVTDEGKLRQIIINLVGNAVKFTKEGGIALRARTRPEKDKIRLVLEVEDTGPGIAKKDIDKLFRKFGQTETGIKEGGTGLGLAISQQYAKFMSGIITVKSEEGKGTCFTLTIDIEYGKELVKEENRKRRVIGLKPGQKQYRILVADDHSDNRDFLKIMLTSAGFEVEEVQNGNETIEKFKVWSPDLILMDMRMPVMDGYEATRRIKAMKNGKIPIIAVTASAFREDRQKSQDAGADGYLRKPFKEHELFESLQSCLGVEYIYESEDGGGEEN